MADQVKILAFSGSLRTGSFNKKILEMAIKGAIEAQAIVTLLDLRDYPLPIYDQDLEDSEGLPENAKKLKSLMRAHDAFLIASPEYNSGYSGALKNMIDWISRQETPEEQMFDCFTGKVAAIMSASPSDLGGLRGLAQLRALLENIYVTVIPQQRTLPQSYTAFDEEGNFKDKATGEGFKGLGSRLVDVARKLRTS